MARPEVKSGPGGKRLWSRRTAEGPGELQRHSLLSFFELSKELDYSLNVYDFADRDRAFPHRAFRALLMERIVMKRRSRTLGRITAPRLLVLFA